MKRILLLVVWSSLVFIPFARAKESSHWWVALDLGVSDLSFDVGTIGNDHTAFSLALRSGYRFENGVQLGIETNGFGIESGNLWDTSKGEGISQPVMLTVEYAPSPSAGFYLKGGTGLSSYWNNRTGFRQTDTGAWLAGVGYKLGIASPWEISPFLSVHGGKVDMIDYQAVLMGVSFRWRF